MKNINQNLFLSRSEIPYSIKPSAWLRLHCKHSPRVLWAEQCLEHGWRTVPIVTHDDNNPTERTDRTPIKAVLRSKPSTELREQRNTSTHQWSTSVEKVWALAPQLFSNPAHPIPLLPGSLDLGSSIPQPPPLPGRARVRLGARRALPPASGWKPPVPTAPGKDLRGARGKGFSFKKKEESDARMHTRGDCEVRGGGWMDGQKDRWMGKWIERRTDG